MARRRGRVQRAEMAAALDTADATVIDRDTRDAVCEVVLVLLGRWGVPPRARLPMARRIADELARAGLLR